LKSVVLSNGELKEEEMAALERFASYLVAEMPVDRLQTQLGDAETERFEGLVCGGGCLGGNGALCGGSCGPRAGASDVFDPEGKLGLTAMDLQEIRNSLPKLRKEVLNQLEAHLQQLR